MSLITRQEKGSKLTIQEMDNNLLYLESLSGNTGFTQAKIGSDTDYSLFDPDGSLTFHGSATTFTDQAVDILTEVVGSGNPLSAIMFRNNGVLSENYAVDILPAKYGSFLVSGYTEFNNAITLGTFSISFWFKSNTSVGPKIMFSIPNSGNTISFGIGQTSTGNKIYVQHNNSSFLSLNSINIGNWYHVCYTQSNSSASLYINSIETVGITPSPILDSIGYGLWGCARLGDSGLTINSFIGSLSNLRIYNITLTSNQVSELYNSGDGLSVESHPVGIIETLDVLYNIKNLENSGSTLVNSSTLGTEKDITLVNSPTFSDGAIGRASNGVFLPAFELQATGSIGDQRSIRFEMNHNWKTGTPIDIHMHTSINKTILSGQTISFLLEYTIQDIYGILSTSSLRILNSGKTFPATSAITFTFTADRDIPPFTNLILEFGNIDMSQYTSVSTCGIMTITRQIGTFTGPIFEIQSIRMHYEIDSTGSRTRYAK